MAAKTSLELGLGYADSTTRKIKIGTFSPSAASTFKAKIKALNANDVDSLSDKLLSDGGASFTGIVSATVFTESVKDINLNDAE